MKENISAETIQKFTNISWKQFVHLVLNQGLFKKRSLEEIYSQQKNQMFEALMLVHWAPIWLTTAVCNPTYQPDIILKLENLGYEFNLFLNIIGLPPSEYTLLQLVVKGLKTESSVERSSSKLDDYKKYFSQLSKIQVYSLYKMYSLDFELFNYSVQKYVECAQD
ncbi:carbohydrate sulfotransferase 11 [Eurytemora carolleeae]|uniref:carbohydrate sulfotransferase 11 n=1 Tax=Eurytemora carolleeae TaxID=1294199 RepID=UPI000C765257|nr:carbohydrate sulfotransferase 11 [Eurytemora carolleeae]|eukprot:XP_023348639.1 carbohydrate sulfotransferase 11-like [Eurytemora affinis]